MRFAIITPYNIPNYGAILQAFALQTYLEKRGHDPVFVNCRYRFPGKFSFVQLLCSRNLEGVFAKVRINRKLKACCDVLHVLKTTEPYYSVKKLYKDPPKADVYLVGSDQVWNFSGRRKRGAYDTMFLNFAPDMAVRMSYAASFGASVLHESVDRQQVAKLLKRFDYISVREESGATIVRNLTSRDSWWVCDPVLLFDESFWANLSDTRQICESNSLFRYMLGWNDSMTLQCFENSLCRELSLSGISDPDSGGFASVGGWVSQLASAKVVLTNSFHGTLFAILFRKTFITLTFQAPHKERNERVASLLRRLNLTDRMFDYYDEQRVRQTLNTPIDWPAVSREIYLWRDQTDELFANVEAFCAMRGTTVAGPGLPARDVNGASEGSIA